VVDGSWPEIEGYTRLADAGLRLIPAPPSAAEAAQAVAESNRSLVATLSVLKSPVMIADTGKIPLSPATHPFVGAATVTVVVHRQSAQSARAAAVRLQRLADALHAFATLPTSVVVAVVGTAPFDVGEIETFLAETAGATPIVPLPVDQLTAAAFSGRTGVSSRRLARLPLMRAAARLAAAVERALTPTTAAPWRSDR
jgi:MinD-like ATPase involved in chromosome partitioning or flagellar assembly